MMERYSFFSALTDAAGSLLIDLAENALQSPVQVSPTSVRSVSVKDRPAELDHAAICRVTGAMPSLFAVAMSAETAGILTKLVLGEMGEVTPMHVANVVSETSQWIASRALPRLGVTDFSFAPETVVADSLSDWFPHSDKDAWMQLDGPLGTLLVGVSQSAD